MILSLLEKYLIHGIGLLDLQISVRLPIKTRANCRVFSLTGSSGQMTVTEKSIIS